LAPDDSDYQQKLAVLAGDESNRRRIVRAYLHRKRRLTTDTANH
jgi:hypothetical protein